MSDVTAAVPADPVENQIVAALALLRPMFPGCGVALVIADDSLPLGNRVSYGTEATRADISSWAQEIVAKTTEPPADPIVEVAS